MIWKERKNCVNTVEKCFNGWIEGMTETMFEWMNDEIMTMMNWFMWT